MPKFFPAPLSQGRRSSYYSPPPVTLLVSLQRPYEIVEQVGNVDYWVQVPSQGRHLYLVNLLKEWHEREDPGFYNTELDWDEESREQSRELQAQVAVGVPASAWQLQQISQVLRDYRDVFVDTPGAVKGVEHNIPPPGASSAGTFTSNPLSFEGNSGERGSIHATPRGYRRIIQSMAESPSLSPQIRRLSACLHRLPVP